MYPVLFEIFGYQVSSFGVAMVVSFLVGVKWTSIRLEEMGRDPDLARRLLIYCVVGGLLGGKLYYATDVSLRTGEPFWSLLLSREGVTWYGGLGVGMLAAWLGCRIQGLPYKEFCNAICAPGAFGQAIGRVGCFLNGDDYGRATDVPWGMAFPQGFPATLERVHPTQLYDAIWLTLVAGFLWKRRHKSPWLGGEYLMLTGGGRILIEVLRVNPKVALGLTEPQLIGLALLLLGIVTWLYYWKQSAGEPEPATA